MENSASYRFMLYGYITMHGQQNIKKIQLYYCVSLVDKTSCFCCSHRLNFRSTYVNLSL